jgi:hypothetical protein
VLKSRLSYALGGSFFLHIAVIALFVLVKPEANHRPNRSASMSTLSPGMTPVAVEPASEVEGVPSPPPNNLTREIPAREVARDVTATRLKVAKVHSEARSPAVVPVQIADAPQRGTHRISTPVTPSPPEQINEADGPKGELSPSALKAAMFDATKRNDVPMVGGGFGSMEMLLKERRLERALTWVFPKVVSYDKSYWQWPMGSIGAIRFTIELDSHGKIIATRFLEASPSVRLKALISKMTLFLRPGRFYVSNLTDDSPIERSFVLTVQQRKRSTAREPSGASEGESVSAELGDIERLGFDAPDDGRPGKGYITDKTGRELVAELREVTVATKSSTDSPGP